MNEENNQLQEDDYIRPLEIIAPVSTLTKPWLPNQEGNGNSFSLGLFRPVNIDIIITTPSDSIAESPYEQTTFLGKAQKTHTREQRKKSIQRRSWLSTYISERRLRNACSFKDYEEAKHLVYRNPAIDLDAGDDKQRTALHISAANGGDDAVDLLLQNGANPNVQDIRGNTPLHLAACSAKLSIVTKLLHHNADISLADFNGQTPLHLALTRLRKIKETEDGKLANGAVKRKVNVREIADLLTAYLVRVGSDQEKADIVALRNKINTVTTEKEIDELGGLLLNFTQMAIDGKDQMQKEMDSQ